MLSKLGIFSAWQKTGLPRALWIFAARDQWAAHGVNMFTDGNVLCHMGSLCAGRCEIEHPAARDWWGSEASYRIYGEAEINPAVISITFDVYSSDFFLSVYVKVSSLNCLDVQKKKTVVECVPGTEVLGQLHVAVECLKQRSKKDRPECSKLHCVMERVYASILWLC